MNTKNRISNAKFQETTKKNNLPLLNDFFKIKISEFKKRIIADVKSELLSKIEIRESVQNSEMMDTIISDLQSNEWKFFRKIINDL